MVKQVSASTGAVARLWVLWSGFHDGVEYAYCHPAANPYLDADLLVTTATTACERRRASAPLDEAVAQSAYTDGWMAGYLTVLRERAGARDESSSSSAHGIQASPRETNSEQLQKVIAFPGIHERLKRTRSRRVTK